MTWRHFKRCTVTVLYERIVKRLPLRLSIELIMRYGKTSRGR